MLVDLHMHSTASDGQYTPTELVELAKQHGLEAISITDHDTVDGLAEALQAGMRMGLKVIPGIELCAREYPTFHILGYGISSESPRLAALCREMKEGRDSRKYRLISFLRDKGIEISIEEVEAAAGGGIIGRPHFAQVMAAKGCVSSVKEAFELYLDTEEFHQRVERSKPSAGECLQSIREAGGMASLAHPNQLGLDDSQLEFLVKRLAGMGLEAIECHYPKHTQAQTAFYLELAYKYSLHVTGGSDFHGGRVKPEIGLAALELSLEQFPVDFIEKNDT